MSRPSRCSSAAGSLLFNRSPRVEPRYVGEVLPEPRMPKDPITRLFPWPMLVAPIILGLSIFAISGQPRSLLVIALSPLMLLGNFVSQKTQIGQRLRKEAEVFERKFEELEETLYRERPRERRGAQRRGRSRRRRLRGGHAARAHALDTTPRALELPRGAPRHHGRASRGPRSSVPRCPRRLPEYVDRVDRLRDRYRLIDGVPVVESLQSVGAIGVAGPTREAADALRGLSVQLFGLHSPNELVAVALDRAGVGAGARVAEVAAAHHERAQPFREMPLADSASTGAALLSGSKSS